MKVSLTATSNCNHQFQSRQVAGRSCKSQFHQCRRSLIITSTYNIIKRTATDIVKLPAVCDSSLWFTKVSKTLSAASNPDFIALWVPLIFATFIKPGLHPIRQPPGNASCGTDCRPPSLRALAPSIKNSGQYKRQKQGSEGVGKEINTNFILISSLLTFIARTITKYNIIGQYAPIKNAYQLTLRFHWLIF